jgi:hypothetical protein
VRDPDRWVDRQLLRVLEGCREHPRPRDEEEHRDDAECGILGELTEGSLKPVMDWSF